MGGACDARQVCESREDLSFTCAQCWLPRGTLMTNRMETKYTDLELAINTLVQNFHSASPNNADTLTAQEFQSMVCSQLPTMVKTAGDQEGLGKLLKEIEVEEGKSVMFKDFWRLVEYLAGGHFGSLSKDKQVKCMKCSLM